MRGSEEGATIYFVRSELALLTRADGVTEQDPPHSFCSGKQQSVSEQVVRGGQM